jgi:tetratricopeptide (TPR) repeat protein
MIRHCPRLFTSIVVAALLACGGCAALDKSGVWTPGPFSKKRQQRRELALREFEEGRDRAEFQSAVTLWELGNLKGCEEALQRLLARKSDHRDGRLLLADVLLARNAADQAGQQLERALLDHPKDAQVQYGMAIYLDSVGRDDEALLYYQRAAAWDPQDEGFRIGYYAAREAANRRSAVVQAPAAAPGQAVAHRGAVVPAGAAAAKNKKDGAADPVVYTDPVELPDRSGGDTALALIARGRVALSAGQKQSAAECFRTAMAQNPNDPQIPLSAATAALRYDQPQLAIEVLGGAESRFPESAAVQRALGMAHLRAGDYESAQLALRQALSLDKSNALAYFLMGCTLAKLGQHEAADEHLRQAQSLDPRYATRR